MKRAGMIWALCCMALGLMAGESAGLMENADFARLDAAGKPEKWEARVRGDNQFSLTPAADGAVLLLKCVDEKEPALLMYRNLPLEAGKRYQVVYEVKGTAGARYLAYCEWLLKPAGADKPVLKGVETRIKNPSAEWTKQQFGFTFPADSTTPYFVFSCSGGEVSFRNLTLTEVK